MADNFLEKRMEDMRTGRLTQSTSRLQKNDRTNKYKMLRAFVTGGANGIGRAIIEELRRKGCRVAFCDIDADEGNKLSEVYGCLFYHLDVRDSVGLRKVMSQLLEEWGDLDIIVNNVGIGDFKPFEECSMADFENVLATNLYPVFITSNILARHREKSQGAKMENMKKDEYGGRIINISSTRHFQSEPGTEAYAASKGAIVSLTHALMMSLRKYRITVNCISPGWINTDPVPKFLEPDIRQHPSQRIGNVTDVARIVSFLIEPENDFINGQDIVVDGGMTKSMIYSGDHGWMYNPVQ